MKKINETTTLDSPGTKGYTGYIPSEKYARYRTELARIIKKTTGYEMVDLEPVNDPEEKRWLSNWIERHREYTGSLKAKKLLENGDLFFKQFVKVMPIEYRAVLEAMKSKAA